MTAQDRDIWRGAFQLYEWNHTMPSTDANWEIFLSAVSDFATRFDWQSCPLASALAFAVIDAVEAEVRARLAEEQARQAAAARDPAQLSFLKGV